tara:strand:- start:71 stop:457 length:387 start_codon:yes stop_codon:yes gene_type:complete
MSEARYWREIPQRYRLEAKQCSGCGKIFFPPRPVCSACHDNEFTDISLPDEGEILSYTIIHVSPSQFTLESPYAMGIIKLMDGVCITTQIVDYTGELKIGQRVKIVFRKIREEGKSGIKCYGYKCVPI